MVCIYFHYFFQIILYSLACILDYCIMVAAKAQQPDVGKNLRGRADIFQVGRFLMFTHTGPRQAWLYQWQLNDRICISDCFKEISSLSIIHTVYKVFQYLRETKIWDQVIIWSQFRFYLVPFEKIKISIEKIDPSYSVSGWKIPLSYGTDVDVSWYDRI